MLVHLRANVLLLVLTILIGAVLYPLTILAVAQGLFPRSASGSLIHDANGRPMGSRLIGQPFKGDEWFHPRPSAVDHNAAGSGGSNLAASNPKLRERAEEILKGRGDTKPLVIDAVTASGSGLDPHITLSNARGQLDRVVSAWVKQTGRTPAEVRERVEALLTEQAFRPLLGLAEGEAIVNVLELNLELRAHLTP